MLRLPLFAAALLPCLLALSLTHAADEPPPAASPEELEAFAPLMTQDEGTDTAGGGRTNIRTRHGSANLAPAAAAQPIARPKTTGSRTAAAKKPAADNGPDETREKAGLPAAPAKLETLEAFTPLETQAAQIRRQLPASKRDFNQILAAPVTHAGPGTAPAPADVAAASAPVAKPAAGNADAIRLDKAPPQPVSDAPYTISGGASPPEGGLGVTGAPPPANLARYQFLPLPLPHAAPDTMPLFWPLLTSRKLALSQELIRRAIIVVHDAGRDAAGSFAELQLLAGPVASSKQAQVQIIAPLFAAPADRAAFKPLLTDAAMHVAAWEPDDWSQGGATVPDKLRPQGVSSMMALDLLLLYIADRKNFPELRSIVIVGAGRGGDFVQRYALYGQAHEMLAQQQLAPRYVVAAAQSYVYFTADRPGKQAGSFAPPHDGQKCADYQNYPYGLELPNAYTRRIAGNVAREHYARRDVTYLVGAEDNAPAADQNCAAALQGRSVKDRAVHYEAYLRQLFGNSLQQRLYVVPNVGDDAGKLLGSSCGVSLLFADGECVRTQ